MEKSLTEELENKYARIGKAAQQLRLARLVLEEEARKKIDLALTDHRLELAVAVREAYNAKQNKSAIGRALHSKDRRTIDELLALTEGVEVVVEEPKGFADVVPELRPNTRFNYDPATGLLKVREGDTEAMFTVDYWEGGQIYLFSQTNLWSEGYTKRNDIVFLLDGKNLVEKENKLAAELLPYIRENL